MRTHTSGLHGKPFHWCIRTGWLAMCFPVLLGIGTVAAQTSMTKDPTVPPPEWLAANPVPEDAGHRTSDAAARVPVVVVGKSRRLAVIDGKVVVPGDMIGDSKVSAIRADKVLMTEDEKSLAVTPNVVKARPVRQKVSKKRVVIPEETSSSLQTGSKK